MNARRLRWLVNLWPPFMGAGIKLDFISGDFRQARVSLFSRWYNRNYVGTHFGGSLFAMTDPFLMIMYMHNLGKDYLVWDQSARIRFAAPGRGRVTARFELTAADLEQARQAAAGGDKYLAAHRLQVLDAQQQVVAEVDKTIYIRLKSRARNTA